MLPPIEEPGTPQAPLRAPLPTPLPDGTIRGGYNNPEGTSPYPAPSEAVRPVGYWESESAGTFWELGETSYAALWNSTTFDLRTDLRGVSSRDLEGYPLNRKAAAQMWIAISGLEANHVGMRLSLSHWGHPVNYAKIARFTPYTDVTGYLATGTDLVILDVFPPGSGYQMRYWQVKLKFEFPLQYVPTSLPSLGIQAGVY